jgi:hypothetical protein
MGTTTRDRLDREREVSYGTDGGEADETAVKTGV